MLDERQLPAHHRAALDYTGRVVAAVPNDAWSRATPCAEWNAHELLNHVVSGNLWSVRLVGGETIEAVGNALDGDLIGGDRTGAYTRSATAAADAFEAPGALDAMCAVSYGPVPGSVYIGHRFLDVLIHGHDLAAATDQDAALPPELVAACWGVVEPQLDMLRASGMFGPDRAPDPNAGDEQRLLTALGR